MRFDRFRDRRGLFDAFHQRGVGDAVAAHADQLRLVIRLSTGKQGFDRGAAEQGAQVAVEGAGRAAALDVPEHGDAHFFAQAIFQHLGDFGAADRVALAVAGTFGDARRS